MKLLHTHTVRIGVTDDGTEDITEITLTIKADTLGEARLMGIRSEHIEETMEQLVDALILAIAHTLPCECIDCKKVN